MDTQADLFGTRPAPALDVPGAEVVAGVRARLHATLALVKAAEAMPWDGLLDIIREDNAFRFGKDLLPAAEGAALWAEFDREMDRLYAVMNAGKELNHVHFGTSGFAVSSAPAGCRRTAMFGHRATAGFKLDAV